MIIDIDKDSYAIEGNFGGAEPTPPHKPVEADDTLSSNQTLRLLFAVSEGRITSIEQVYVNGTTFTGNFSGSYEYRHGDASQEPCKGFSDVETPYAGTGTTAQLLYNIPYTRAVSAARVTGVRISLKVQALKQIINGGYTIDGDTWGYSVDFDIYARPNNTAPWTLVGNTVKTGKASSPYVWDIRVNRPAGAGVWEFRVIRRTIDDPDSKVISISYLDNYTEIQDVTLSYDNTALVALTFKNAKELGGGIPTISFYGRGIEVKVPHSSVYNASARTYASTIWDGTWNLTNYASSNPAWTLYYLLTNGRAGLGQEIQETDVDKFSFFELARRCDELVSNGKGGTEHRYSFDTQFYVRESASVILTYLLTICDSNLANINGLITVVTDRPTTATKIVTNSNVIDGDFTYSSSELSERYTAVNVTYNNPLDKGNTTTITEQDNAAVARYGYNTIDVVLVGCTSAGQAKRKARSVLEVATEILTFKNGFEGFNYSIGEVISVMDDNSANVLQQGRVIARSTVGGITTISLDRTLSLPNTPLGILLYSADGRTTTKWAILESNITTNTVSRVALSTEDLPPIGSPFILEGNIIPRPWRVTSITWDDGVHTISCVNYDGTKYSRIDTGVNVPTPGNHFVDVEEFETEAVTGITFAVEHEGGIKGSSSLHIKWNWSHPKYKATYSLLYRRDNLAFKTISDIYHKEVEIPNIVPGIYEVIVYAFNLRGIRSPGATATYSYRTTAGTSTLAPPINIVVSNTGNLTFNSANCSIIWSYDPANDHTEDKLHHYQIEVWSNNNLTKLNTYIVQPNRLKGGAFIYTLAMNRADYGYSTPNRRPNMKFYSVDTLGDLSEASIKVFNNPPVAAPSFSLMAGLSALYVDITPSEVIDLVGYVVYTGSSSNFIKGNPSYKGPDPYVTIPVTNSNKIYVVVGAYDTFGLAGVLLSTEQSVIPLSLEANTYTKVGLDLSVDVSTKVISWISGTIYNGNTKYQIQAGAATWTSGILYLYFAPNVSPTTLRTTTTFGLAVASNCWPYATYGGGGLDTVKGGDGQAFISGSSILAGTIGAAQLIAGSAIVTGTSQIANAIIENAHIQDATIAFGKISDTLQSTNYKNGGVGVVNGSAGWRLAKSGSLRMAGGLTITDDDGNIVLDANGIDGTHIKNATIGTAQIGNAAITTAKIGALAVNSLQIAGNAVTIPIGIYTNTARNITTTLAWITLISTNMPASTVPVSTNFDVVIKRTLTYNLGPLSNLNGSISRYRVVLGSIVLLDRDASSTGNTLGISTLDVSAFYPTIATIPANTGGTLALQFYCSHPYTRVIGCQLTMIGMKR
jgi:hypothetical protein